MKNQLFDEIYCVDAFTNRYMIEIALDRYSDVFNEWNPALFKRRDVDPDLEDYLERSSGEIPVRHAIELCFVASSVVPNEQTEEELRRGLADSFGFKLYLIRKQLKKTNFRMLWFVTAGLVLLGIAAAFFKRVTEVFILTTLIEGLFIAGWVFGWETISTFFFTNRKLYEQYLTYKRLQKALVVFRAPEEPSMSTKHLFSECFVDTHESYISKGKST